MRTLHTNKCCPGQTGEWQSTVSFAFFNQPIDFINLAHFTIQNRLASLIEHINFLNVFLINSVRRMDNGICKIQKCLLQDVDFGRSKTKFTQTGNALLQVQIGAGIHNIEFNFIMI